MSFYMVPITSSIYVGLTHYYRGNMYYSFVLDYGRRRRLYGTAIKQATLIERQVVNCCIC